MKNLINNKTIISIVLTIFLSIAATAQNVEQRPNKPDGVAIQTTAFTYQGRLTEMGMSGGGTFDFQFALYAFSSGGTEIGTENIGGVTVTNGIFTVRLDFGEAGFPDEERFLEIRVKRQTDANYTTLAPRQEITSAPVCHTRQSCDDGGQRIGSRRHGGGEYYQGRRHAPERCQNADCRKRELYSKHDDAAAFDQL